MTNLEDVRGADPGDDEMRELRKEQERMEAEKREKADKKERKDSKKKREGSDEGRVSKSPMKDEDELEVGQKPLEEVFKDTGMDPNPNRRSKVLKRARKVAKKGKKGKKKKEKGSTSSHSASSSTSSCSSSLDVGQVGIFEEEKRLKAAWKRSGALSHRGPSKRSRATSSQLLGHRGT